MHGRHRGDDREHALFLGSGGIVMSRIFPSLSLIVRDSEVQGRLRGATSSRGRRRTIAIASAQVAFALD